MRYNWLSWMVRCGSNQSIRRTVNKKSQKRRLMNLTEHFTLEEFTRSSTASRLKIDNSVPKNLMPNVQLTAIKFELVRKALGKPIIITSGYRCPALNA